MKRMYKFLALFLIFNFFVLQINSQVKFGVKAGVNLSTMLDKDSIQTYSDDYKIKPGFNLGATGTFLISESFAIESGLVFSSKGYKMEESGSEIGVSLYYFEVPLNLLYKLDLSSFSLIVHSGPYFGIGTRATAKSDEYIFTDNNGNEVNKKNLNLGKSKSDFAKQLDYGVNAGVGVEFEPVTFCIQYGFGLANLSNNLENENELKNRVLSISIAYNIGQSTKGDKDNGKPKKNDRKIKSRGGKVR